MRAAIPGCLQGDIARRHLGNQEAAIGELAGEVLPDADVDGTDVIAIGVVVGTQHHDAAPAFRQGLQPREHFRIGVTRGGAA